MGPIVVGEQKVLLRLLKSKVIPIFHSIAKHAFLRHRMLEESYGGMVDDMVVCGGTFGKLSQLYYIIRTTAPFYRNLQPGESRLVGVRPSWHVKTRNSYKIIWFYDMDIYPAANGRKDFYDMKKWHARHDKWLTVGICWMSSSTTE